MNRRFLSAGVLFVLTVAAPLYAHRLDEFLQATTISVDKDHVQAQVRLTPGVAVFPIVMAGIDTDADGVISEAEQRNYAQRVLHDLSLSVDGERLPLQLISTSFPGIVELREGRGEIQLELIANVPGTSAHRTLTLDNHHQSAISVYLVNALVPRDKAIRVTRQNRNYQQSFYQLDYEQAGVGSTLHGFRWRSATGGWLALIALVLFARLAFQLRRQRAPGHGAR